MRTAPIAVVATFALAGFASAQSSSPPAAGDMPAVESQAEAPALFSEPRMLTAGINFANDFVHTGEQHRKEGIYPEMSNMISGSGWLSAGAGYRLWFGNQAFLDASAGLSWHTYKAAQLRFELPALASDRLAVGTQLAWNDFTQIHYFGIGQDSLEENASEYRMKTTDTVGYVTFKPNAWFSVSGGAGYLDAATLSSSAGWFDADYPSTLEMFAGEPGAADRPPSFVHGDASALVDTRDHPGHPTEGGVYRAAWTTFWDRDLDRYSFNRYEVEGAQFVPVFGGRVVFAGHGWGVFTDTSPDRDVPFYLLPSLGGSNTLRGERTYRFHDRNLVLVTGETRLAVWKHMDAAVFVDAGNVAAHASDLDLARRSYGVGLRIHDTGATFARLDVAHGSEQGWRVLFRVNEPFRLSRFSRRTAPMPFVP